MSEIQTLKKEKKSPKQRKPPIIDCDIHNAIPSVKELHPYLSERWRKHLEMVGTPSRIGSNLPRGVPAAARRDAWPPSGKIPGSDLGFMQEQLLDHWNIEYGVLNFLDFQAVCNLRGDLVSHGRLHCFVANRSNPLHHTVSYQR